MSKLASSAIGALCLAFAISGCGGSQTGQSGQPVAQDKAANRSVKQASSPYAAAVQELYVAYFGRPADPGGLTNFENALAAANAPQDIAGLTKAYSTNVALRSLIDSFGTSKESQTLYGSGTTQDFVTAVFTNVLGRAPLQAGLDYWSGAIDGGSLSKGDAALAIMAGALANTSAQGLVDTQLINNRLAVAASFTAQVADAGATGAYSGAAAAGSARAMLAQVTSTTNDTAFAATVNATVNALLQGQPGIFLVAGNTVAGVPLNNPNGLVLDASGNIYVIDSTGNTLDKISPDGTFTTLAGSFSMGAADGAGDAASFYYPDGLAIDSKGNLYVSDNSNSTIRKVTQAGVVTTVAGMAGATGSTDGSGQNARFFYPRGVAVDAGGNLYVADTNNQTIRKITAGGVVSTIAGQNLKCGYADGVGSGAQFCNPASVAVDAAGNVYVADLNNLAIRKITPNGTVSTLAGNPKVKNIQDGTGSAAQFCTPTNLALDNAGDLLVTDQGCSYLSNSVIRKVTLSGVVTTFAGNSSTSVAPLFLSPMGAALDAGGNLFVADYGANAVLKISASGTRSIVASLNGVMGSADGAGTAAGFAQPQGLVADASGNLLVADWMNSLIRKVTPFGQVGTLAGGGVSNTGQQDGTGTAAIFSRPLGMATDASGNLYVMDSYSGKIRMVTPAGVVTTLAITAGQRYITYGTGMARDASGNLYVSDNYNNIILKITPAGAMSILAGTVGASGSTDGPGAAARFSSPNGLAVDAAGNLFVADTNNNTVRMIDANGNVTTVVGAAGSSGFVDGIGSAARLHFPKGLAFDATGNLYIADMWNNAIRKLAPSGVLSTVAGSATGSNTVQGALPGTVNRPEYLTVVGSNTLYVTSDNAVLRIQLP